jgi:cellobiose-specific phosphotransferase system component IIA
MLLSLEAVRKLKDVVQDYYNEEYYYPRTTHRQRNRMSHMFLEEADKLLDQKAESTLKHAVERYMDGEISYEQYIEIVECTSQEEGERGAAYGRESARNKTFEKAQKFLDEAKKHDDELKLTKEKKEYEAKRVEMVMHIRQAEKASLAAIESAKTEAGEQVRALVDQQKDVLLAGHEAIEQRTEQKVEALLTTKIAQAQEQAIQEVREQELLKPGRDAVQAAIRRAMVFERRAQRDKWWKYVLLVLTGLFSVGIVIGKLFFFWPDWTILFVLVGGVLFFCIFSLVDTKKRDEQVKQNKQKIGLYQTRGGEFAGLSEEERQARLIEQIIEK